MVMGPFDITINFSADVSGLELSDFSISNGNATDLSGSGSSYTLTVNPNLPGNLTIALPANRAEDANNNGNLASNQLLISFDALPGNETDLDLNFTTTETGFIQYDFVTLTLTIENTSTVDAANVVVSYPKPENTAFSEQTISAGEYADFSGEWVIGNLPAGTSEVLEVTWFSLDDEDPIVAYAQVMSASPEDLDSSPGNGTCCTAVEDDEAVISVDPGTTQLRSSLAFESNENSSTERLKILKPYPNPVVDRLMISFYVPQARTLMVRLTNSVGQEVYRSQLELNEGLVKRTIDMQDFPTGLYYLSTDLEGKHRALPVLKVER